MSTETSLLHRDQVWLKLEGVLSRSNAKRKEETTWRSNPTSDSQVSYLVNLKKPLYTHSLPTLLETPAHSHCPAAEAQCVKSCRDRSGASADRGMDVGLVWVFNRETAHFLGTYRYIAQPSNLIYSWLWFPVPKKNEIMWRLHTCRRLSIQLSHYALTTTWIREQTQTNQSDSGTCNLQCAKKKRKKKKRDLRNKSDFPCYMIKAFSHF